MPLNVFDIAIELTVDVYAVEYVRHKHLTKMFIPLNMFGINIQLRCL